MDNQDRIKNQKEMEKTKALKAEEEFDLDDEELDDVDLEEDLEGEVVEGEVVEEEYDDDDVIQDY